MDLHKAVSDGTLVSTIRVLYDHEGDVITAQLHGQGKQFETSRQELRAQLVELMENIAIRAQRSVRPSSVNLLGRTCQQTNQTAVLAF